MQNPWHDNEFDMRENGQVGGTHFHMNGSHGDWFSFNSDFDSETKDNSKVTFFESINS